ncbi:MULTISPECIES: ABC transporter permease [unclassified Micromonospora]|uniref:ABC transporter permease n=1 Tax=unclassified Micromonospora TaxID=2617518 RepID=UPI003A8C0CDF
MAVTGPGTGGAVTGSTADAPAVAGRRPVRARHFVRLKLRVMGNNLRGQGWRIALFIGGIIAGLWFAGNGFLILAAPGFVDSEQGMLLAAGFGGSLLVLGWLLLPLAFFGVDETLDPARFALLPLPRRTMVTGLLVTGLIGVPSIATGLATLGLVLSAALLGGPLAGTVQLVGVAAGLLLCVLGSRAITSAFAGMLRSRRVRDLAAVLLAVLAALLGPLQLLVIGGLGNADWDRLAEVAGILGWTPLAAPYTMGFDVVAGRLWAVPVKLAVTAVALAGLYRWWSRSLESAMVGTASGGPARSVAAASGTPVSQLFPRLLARTPRDRYGALVAREVRYWWRDMRRRANLITVAVVGVFIPALINAGGFSAFTYDPDGSVGTGPSASATSVSISMLFVGALAAVTLANQFGFDGSAYAANVIAGVPGRLELRARVVGFSVYIGPLLVAISAGFGLFLREPGWIPVAAGTLFAAYGAGLAVNLIVSVVGAYSLPETSNPFALNSGAGVAKSMLALVAMVASAAAAVPIVLATALLGEVWYWFALPVGVGYGLGAVALGLYITGDLLDRRMPELVATVTPRR